jgi:hypothetical protein
VIGVGVAARFPRSSGPASPAIPPFNTGSARAQHSHCVPASTNCEFDTASARARRPEALALRGRVGPGGLQAGEGAN